MVYETYQVLNWQTFNESLNTYIKRKFNEKKNLIGFKSYIYINGKAYEIIYVKKPKNLVEYINVNEILTDENNIENFFKNYEKEKKKLKIKVQDKHFIKLKRYWLRDSKYTTTHIKTPLIEGQKGTFIGGKLVST